MLKEEAFLAQARSDYRVLEALLKQPRDVVPECHVLHYLQMATEKLAKAFLAQTGAPVGASHRAFSRLAAALANRQDVLRAIGYRDPSKCARFLKRATPVFEQIEALCPSEANRLARSRGLSWDQGQNVEYPWWQHDASRGEDWLAPANQTFAAFQTISQRSGDGASMLTLVNWLLARFGHVR